MRLDAAMLGRELCPGDPVDPGIARAVKVLQEAGVETFEACEGGPGHAYAEPTVRFHGGRESLWVALAAAAACGLPVLAVRRTWPVNDGEPTGPHGEITFREQLA